MEKEIVSSLGCSPKAYFNAVNYLIQTGVFYKQKNGVLYDTSGKVVGLDETRVDASTLQLKENPL